MTRKPQLDLFGEPLPDADAPAPPKAPAQRGPRAPTARDRGVKGGGTSGSELRSTAPGGDRDGGEPLVRGAAGAGDEGASSSGGASRREPGTDAGPQVIPVGVLARLIKGTLEAKFHDVLVRGEISNLRQPGSGHLYFSLKDGDGSLRAVLFRGQARLLRFRPDNGQEVLARGRVGFYEASGDAQLVCESLEPLGAGALALAFEQRKAQLAAEGLFAKERKRRIPFLPERIGVVTSPTGAAIHDFVRVLHRRFPRIEVLIAPARVQGVGAAEEIAAGIEGLARRGDRDVIVLTRGGGSIEDLWAFNEEIVARAIAACPVPVVSAVGHEVDFTIADFVADLRAPTPTGAAELLAPVEQELRASVAIARSRVGSAARRGIELRRGAIHRMRARLGDPSWRLADSRLRVDAKRQRAAELLRGAQRSRRRRLEALEERLRQVNPLLRLKQRSRQLDQLRDRLLRIGRTLSGARRERLRILARELAAQSQDQRILREARLVGELRTRLIGAMGRGVDLRRARIEERGAELRALSPLRVLARGYSIAFAESGAVLFAASDVAKGARLHLELAEGALWVEVLDEAKARK